MKNTQIIPLIGVSGSIEHDESKQFIVRDYLTAILSSGGIPFLLSMDMDDSQIENCLSSLSGILLAGGGDIDPSLFGEAPHPALGEVDPIRDRFEMRLLRAAEAKKLPIFGICRGMQVMNVMRGGTLYQDIAAEYSLDHHAPAMLHQQRSLPKYSGHVVQLKKKTLLSSLFSSLEFPVNSFHHQAVRRVAPGLIASASAPDSLIEAIEDPAKLFWLGVQWHPERMFHSGQNTDEAKLLFRAFISAAARFAADK